LDDRLTGRPNRNSYVHRSDQKCGKKKIFGFQGGKAVLRDRETREETQKSKMANRLPICGVGDRSGEKMASAARLVRVDKESTKARKRQK